MDCEGFSKYDKLIAIDLTKKPWFKITDYFISRHDEDNATMFFINEKSEEATFEVSQNAVTVV